MNRRRSHPLKNQDVADVFDSYPDSVRARLLSIRQLILATAAEIESVGPLEETLKWGEPSYLATESKSGSTIRLGWKDSEPHEYALHFHCATKLVDTFREIYGGQLRFAGNRAIVFNENDDVPVEIVKHCISLCLTYHRIKHLPLLGA